MRTVPAGFHVINALPAIESPAAAPSSSLAGQHVDTWHSPVPYLFGGLAAMLGLIAFSLLILACSYWRLSAFLEDDVDGGGNDHDNNGKPDGGDVRPPPKSFCEGFVVIMAGDDKPTFLATPTSSRAAASFGDYEASVDVDDGKKAPEGAVTDAGRDRTLEQY